MTPQRRSTNHTLWDGNDRRTYDDRRNPNAQPPQPSYFEQMILQHLEEQAMNNQVSSQQIQQSTPKFFDNIAQGSLTLTQIGGILIVLGSLLFSGFGVWSSLNKEIDTQKSTFVIFKDSISKDIDSLNRSVADLKHFNEDLKSQNQKSFDGLDRRIQDLDASISQIYQKVSKK